MLFPDMEESMFTNDSAENIRRIKAYWEYIKSIFEEVQEYTAFEKIREQKEREKYVM